MSRPVTMTIEQERDDGGETTDTKEPIRCGPLLFRWSDAIEGYWANLGSEEIQLQILSEDNGGHWDLKILTNPLEAHDPADVAKTLYDLIRFARDATREGFEGERDSS